MKYMFTKQNVIVSFVALCLLVSLATFLQPNDVSASAPSGLQATLATSTTDTVSSTASSIFATSTCAARIISTGASAIMLTFSDYAGQTPTGSSGLLQSASTTVVYDSGQYGCGLVKVYSYTSQSITVAETR